MFLDFKEKGLRGIQELVEMEWSPETGSYQVRELFLSDSTGVYHTM